MANLAQYLGIPILIILNTQIINVILFIARRKKPPINQREFALCLVLFFSILILGNVATIREIISRFVFSCIIYDIFLEGVLPLIPLMYCARAYRMYLLEKHNQLFLKRMQCSNTVSFSRQKTMTWPLVLLIALCVGGPFWFTPPSILSPSDCSTICADCC